MLLITLCKEVINTSIKITEILLTKGNKEVHTYVRR